MKKVLKIRLKEILREKNIEQKELASMTGLTTRTVSELCTNTMKRYPREVIPKIVDALNITSFDELFYIDIVEEDGDWSVFFYWSKNKVSMCYFEFMIQIYSETYY